MMRTLAALIVGSLVVPAGAQVRNTDTTTQSLADNPPAVNVRGGAVRERAPGRIVDAARSRHVELSRERLAAQRSRDTSSLATFDPTAAGGSSFSNLLGGASSGLLNTLLGSGLAGSLTGGSGGGLSFGNLVGGNRGTTGGSSAGTSGTTGGTSNLPPEVIQMLQAFGIDPGSLNMKANNAATAQSKNPVLTRQTSNPPIQEEPRFVVRWADAMLSTLFTAVTVGFAQQSFIDLLKSGIKAMIEPFTVPTDATADSNGSQSDGESSGGDTASSGDTGGDSSGGDTGGSSNPII